MPTPTSRWSLWFILGAIGTLLLVSSQDAHALITGGTGNEPVGDSGWAAGASAVFNTKSRVAYWEGPPFGGGEWHAECRGDATAFNQVLADFAKVEVKSRKLVIHDGTGRSFWLNPNDAAEKRESARIDWTFTIWSAANWEHLQQLPAQLRPRGGQQEMPPPVIDVYIGGNIKWADVRVPDGIDVVDERLESHGFTLTDGTVLEGTVTFLHSAAPKEATVHLELIAAKEGKHEYTRVMSATTDGNGHWTLKSVPAGWYRVVAEAPTFVPRIAGYQQLDGSPRWSGMTTALAKNSTVTGIVRDEQGNPLQDVSVRLREVDAGDSAHYETPTDLVATTNVNGRFALKNVPDGRVRVIVRKDGYFWPGVLGRPIETPAVDESFTMQRAANAHVVVNFGNSRRPDEYLVEMEPEGGNVVGSFGGSATLPANNESEFKNAPPGKYVFFFGRPNPGSVVEETERVTVELRGGETTTVTLKAK